MTFKELDQQLNVQFIPIPSGKRNRPGGNTPKTSITIHNTGNANRGAHALAHSKWVTNTGFYWLKDANGNPTRKNYVSWHYTVDELRVVKHLPTSEKSIHAGKAAGNTSSIGIEICMNDDMDFDKACDRAAKLVAVLMKAFNIPITEVHPHHKWSGKNCPARMLNNGKPGPKWQAFLNLAQGYFIQASGPMPMEDPEPDDTNFEPE